MPGRVVTTEPNGLFPDSSFKHSPLTQVRSLFVRFAQGLFGAMPHGQWKWLPDLQDTEIVISDENPVRTDTIGKRPAISFTRGPVQFYSLGMDDRMEYDLETGAKVKSVLVPGTMSVNCCARNDIESEVIAWVFSEQLWMNRELLMAAGFFEIGRQPSLGAPSPAGSIVSGDNGHEWYCTTVQCPFQFYRTSQATPLNKRIVRNISMSLQTSLQQVQQGQTPVDGNVNPPYNVATAMPPSFAPNASDSRGGTPNSTGSSSPNLPLAPHPLNPAQMVTVRVVRPARVHPPGHSALLPITTVRVEESTANVTDPSLVKV